MTHNNLPHLHQLARNTNSFSGFNRRGISPGTVFGRDMSKLLSGKIRIEDRCLPLAAVAPVGLRSVCEQLYEKGACAAHLVGAWL